VLLGKENIAIKKKLRITEEEAAAPNLTLVYTKVC
jgi:hypothetical protein